MNETVVVITGAEPLHPQALADLPDHPIVIAADSGLDHALAARLHPAGLVGDLDSVSPAALAWAEEHATIARHDPDKDQTDTELALEMAAGMQPERLVLVSGGGDRLDHTIAAIGALGHPEFTSIPRIDAWWGSQRIRVLHGPGVTRFDDLPPGCEISLLAMHGRCRGVAATGVKWPLEAAELEALVGHGVSNVTIEPEVVIAVSRGVLTIFVNAPHDDTTEVPR